MFSTSSRPPRILEVLYSMRVGGSELLGLDLARALRTQGAEVFCTAIDGLEGPLLNRCKDCGLHTVDLGLPMKGLLSRNGFSHQLQRRIAELDVDAVHLQHFLSLNKIGLPAKLAGVKRIVVTEHSVLDVSQSVAGRFRIKLNWRLADSITVIHPSIRNYLIEKLGLPETRITVVPVGIDLERWHRADRQQCRERLSLRDEFVFAFVGRLAPVKNVPQLISTFMEQQSTSDTPAKLLIVGGGEEMQTCKEKIAEHPNGSSVSMLGEQADVRSILAAADVFVMNSRSEGTPRAMLEAMAMGLPAICPAVGGVPDMLRQRGWLTAPNNPADMRAAMEDAIKSPTKVSEFGRNAQRYVADTYDSRAIVHSYQKLLLPDTAW
jgi:glycosyltransferase involved in cell wall biosynthesis